MPVQYSKIIKYLVVFFLALTSRSLSAQKEAWNWFLADSAGIQWVNGDSAVSVDWYNLHGEEGSGSISDSDGNLLFYTNGVDIFDYKHRKLNTDFSLNGDWSSTQGKLILKHPESNEYHVFTNKYIGLQKSQLYHTSFIWEGDSARFINKAKVISNLVSEGIGAVNHQNNRDIIIMYHSLYGDTFYSQLISKTGINNCKKISITGLFVNSIRSRSNTIFFSPTGSLCSFSAGEIFASIDIYKFNNQLMPMSDRINLGPYNGYYSGIFSPNDSMLYIEHQAPCGISQFNLNYWNIDSIKKNRNIIFNIGGFNRLSVRNAPNGELLITRRYKHYVSIINDANKPYPNCGFVDTAINLKQGTCRLGNYNTNQSYFYTPAINYKYTQDCNTNDFDFTGMDTFAASSHYWEVSKGSTLYTYSSKQAAVAFPDTGIWTVKYRASNGVRSDSVTKEIEIFPVLKGFLGPDKGYCGNALPIPLPGPKGMNCYTWQTPHGTISGLDSISADTPGIYILEACNPVFCTYTDTIAVFERFALETPLIAHIGDSLIISNPEADVIYKWYRDSAFLGVLGLTLNLEDSGTYKAQGYLPINCYSPWGTVYVEQLANYNSFESQGIRMFPNPTTGDIILESTNCAITQITIFNATGTIVYDRCFSDNLPSLSLGCQLKPGVYTVKINDGYFSRLIVQ